MKKLSLLLLLLLAAPAFGADHTVTLTTNNEAWAERQRLIDNAQVCVNLGLPSSCTKAEATAANATAGADYAADVDAWVKRCVKDRIAAAKANQDQADRNAWLAASQIVIATGSNAQKNALCAAAALANGCLP
jgi:hypothetical protein